MPALTWMHCICHTDPSWYGFDCASKGKAHDSRHTKASAEAILLIFVSPSSMDSGLKSRKGVVQSGQIISEPPTRQRMLPRSRTSDCSLLTTFRKGASLATPVF